MTHTTFVMLSYGAAALVFAIVMAWVLLERRRTVRELAALEKAGVTRRADAGSPQ